jgi:hypothetical protein
LPEKLGAARFKVIAGNRGAPASEAVRSSTVVRHAAGILPSIELVAVGNQYLPKNFRVVLPTGGNPTGAPHT